MLMLKVSVFKDSWYICPAILHSPLIAYIEAVVSFLIGAVTGVIVKLC